MSIAGKLTHSITVTSAGAFDAYGQRIPGLQTTDVPCFIDGKLRRVVDKNGEGVTSDFSILFLPSVDLEVGGIVSDGVDRAGNLLLAAGRIILLEDSNHPIKGRVIREVYVAETVSLISS